MASHASDRSRRRVQPLKVLGWLRRWHMARALERRAIPDAMWQVTLGKFPFLTWRTAEDLAALRAMTVLFLDRKEFTGAHGLHVSDDMAVAVAAQACLPALRLGIDWYDGFKGIVLHADAVVAQREYLDDDGVVHAYEEELSGEAMYGGPVMLAWRDVDEAGDSAETGYNVVIHEFVHVMDMRSGEPDGIPDLPDRESHAEWVRVLTHEYEAFCDRVDADKEPLLDPYAAEAPEEFFAVAAEAFFVSPRAFQTDHPDLYDLFSRFFLQDPAVHAPL